MRELDLGAPTTVSWQLTRDCDLACRHCCTDSAPGRALPDELSEEQAYHLAVEILTARVPRVVLCGGEPTRVPHFFEVAERLGRGGIALKIETNGQTFTREMARRLARFTVVAIQISLDGATAPTYARMRKGGRLDRALAACEAVRAEGLPLEITFAPTRLNIHEAEAVIDTAAALGAFRLNTGMLMRLGTAAKSWDQLEPSRDDYAAFFRLLRRKEGGAMELAYKPWSLPRELKALRTKGSGTLLVLPNGLTKICAALPLTCGDVRTHGLLGCWSRLRDAWSDPHVLAALERVAEHPEKVSRANEWISLEAATAAPPATAATGLQRAG
jgi:MoaA/NifB/PqqE/SkfB family radical SAM enzyme